MKEIIQLTLISGLTFLIFLVMLILGFAQKNKPLKLISVFVFLAFIGLSCFTVIKFLTKSYNKVTGLVKPRTGEEIYKALFGNTKTDCVKILNYQDQVVPKIDYAIWLHFETCPSELNRILSLHEYKSKKVSTKGWITDGPSVNEKWFKPKNLGDSIIVFEFKKDEYGNWQWIYSSMDSGRVFVEDVAD